MITLWIFIGIIAWYFVGCFALALSDSEDKILFKWASSAPYPGLYLLVVICWPYVIWKFRKLPGVSK